MNCGCVCGALRFSQDQSLWYLWPSSSHTGLPVSGELQERRTFLFFSNINIEIIYCPSLFIRNNILP